MSTSTPLTAANRLFTVSIVQSSSMLLRGWESPRLRKSMYYVLFSSFAPWKTFRIYALAVSWASQSGVFDSIVPWINGGRRDRRGAILSSDRSFSTRSTGLDSGLRSSVDGSQRLGGKGRRGSQPPGCLRVSAPSQPLSTRRRLPRLVAATGGSSYVGEGFAGFSLIAGLHPFLTEGGHLTFTGVTLQVT